MQAHRIGVLTSGGDCPGLNAVLRGVAMAVEKRGWQVIGFRDGFEGLLPPAQYIILDRKTTAWIMQQGGTILGTTSKGHFVAKTGAGKRAQVSAQIIEKARRTLAELEIEGLIVIGGDGSLTTALQPQGRIANHRRAKDHRQRSAVQLTAQRKFGTMVSYQNSGTSDVPIADAVNRLRLVDPNHQLIATAREIGISFGD